MKLDHILRIASAGIAVAAVLGPVASLAQQAAPVGVDAASMDPQALAATARARPYSPYADRNFPTRPFFGDTHLHTALSMDAGAAGARLDPAAAYRFARGEQVMASSGQPVKLSRPLDFLVVADHSDNMGFFPKLFAGDPATLADPKGREWYQLISSGRGIEAALDIVQTFSAGKFPPALLSVPGTPTYRSAWHETIKAAEEANEPGRFTAFIGYEWTSNTAGNNLHRNVIYRDDGSFARQVEPLVTLKPWGSDNPRDLWKWMEDYEAKTGGDVLAIAHNGNLSNGRMFPRIESFTGRPIDSSYAEGRARWEPLYEATQTKGDGETHPYLSPNDEFADYETWDKGNLTLTEAKTPEMLDFEYVRSALKNGLALAPELGTNPYKFGLIGSTDAHTGLTAIEEDNFFGKLSSMEPNPERVTRMFMKHGDLSIMEWEVGAAGYAAVWATENTREALFDAMERRETYATTGSRMIVRFFGGWDYVPEDAESRLPAETGYTKGVPMGGDLTDAPEGRAPSFLVAALKDPIGANLDRIQIIKGWIAEDGTRHERVHDVVWGDADRRQPGADGKLPAVGNTVDVAEASWTNTIGDPELITVWTDPEFDPRQRAFYYARVLEIPTPRWTAYDAKFFGVTPPAEVPMVHQERAYTSPIWYTPKG
ncbi:DUF3604 domain-containing protein [Limibaculum sp. FT325]|uniref:DUF3604 domain-containing protein n=1 Tax=Thermohalobaculum sediminis TaxID=2939436 RepID=UPI0020C1781A|nr:DUF3604 domain-containing protein [Limibaculum sediminis]MCL5776905.1 DUF3604 domain-containing protein [Limibaculum sediminis]